MLWFSQTIPRALDSLHPWSTGFMLVCCLCAYYINTCINQVVIMTKTEKQKGKKKKRDSKETERQRDRAVERLTDWQSVHNMYRATERLTDSQCTCTRKKRLRNPRVSFSAEAVEGAIVAYGRILLYHCYWTTRNHNEQCCLPSVCRARHFVAILMRATELRRCSACRKVRDGQVPTHTNPYPAFLSHEQLSQLRNCQIICLSSSQLVDSESFRAESKT